MRKQEECHDIVITGQGICGIASAFGHHR